MSLYDKITEARAAGYSDDEILETLRKKYPVMGARIDTALSEQYKPTEIIDYLSKRDEPKVIKPEIREPAGASYDAFTGTFTPETSEYADPLGAGKALLAGVKRLPQELAATVIQTAKGISGATVTNKGPMDRFLEENERDREEFVKKYGSEKQILPGVPISVKDVAELPTNLAYSGTSAVTGLLAGGATLAATKSPTLAWTAGGAASGAVAYRATANQIMQQYLEAMNETAKEQFGRNITPEEEEKLKSKFSNLASAYGLWEAIPEAIGNVAELKVLLKPLSKMVGQNIASRIIKKVAGTYGTELGTETVTQMGQQQVESQMGLTQEAPRQWTSATDWATSAKEVAPAVFLLTTIMGGAVGGTAAVYRKYKSKALSDTVQNLSGNLDQMQDEEVAILLENAKEIKKKRPFDKNLDESIAKIEAEAEKRKAATPTVTAEEVNPETGEPISTRPALPQDFFDQMKDFIAAGKDKNGNPFTLDHAKVFRERYASDPKANPQSIRLLDEFIENAEAGNLQEPTEDTTQIMDTLRAEAMQGLPVEQVIAKGNEIKARHPKLADDINKLIIEFQGKKLEQPTVAPTPEAVPVPQTAEIVAPAPAGEAVAPKKKAFDPDNDRQRNIFVSEILKSDSPEVKAMIKQAEEAWPGEDPLPVVESQINYDLQKTPDKWLTTDAGKRILARKGWGEKIATPTEKIVKNWKEGEAPSFEAMVKDAQRWQGAAIKADAAYGKDKKARLAHSKITTKADLEAYLMKKYGVDATTARDVSNELTRKNLKPDSAAEIAEFAGEPWADKALVIVTTAKEVKPGTTFYHGTSAKDDFASFKDDLVYLSEDKDETKAFAESPILGGSRGEGEPRILKITAKGGKVKNINDTVQNVVMEGDDLNAAIAAEAKQARKEGYRYLSFEHPSTIEGVDEFAVKVSLYPAEDLKIEGKFVKEVTPKTEKTKAGVQAIIPGASEAETFGITPSEGEIGTAAPSIAAGPKTATIEEVAKAIEEKPLSEKSMNELVKDAFSIINDHIKKHQGLSFAGTGILNDELFQKLKPIFMEMARRAKAKAVDVKGYIFGAVNAMEEGTAKAIYEEAATQYVEEEAAAKVKEQPKAEPALEPTTTKDLASELFRGFNLRVTKDTTKNGNEVWNVSGATKYYKEQLKQAGGRWYGPKKVWSFYKGDPTEKILGILRGKKEEVSEVKVAAQATQEIKEKQPEARAAMMEMAEEAHETALTAKEQTAYGKVSEWVKAQLYDGKAFGREDLFDKAAEAFGGTIAEGKFSAKDAYDAMELGINQHIRDAQDKVLIGRELHVTDKYKIAKTPAGATADVLSLKTLNDIIPTQTTRTAEMDEFQQFSTPPAFAYVANWVANIKAGETYLEPSAGTGNLAIFGKIAGARVIVNEISPRRVSVLKELGFARIHTENAEQLNNILPDDVKPTVIVMNPPFSATGGRMQGERKTANGAVHIEQALKRLEPGGRLVAIVGEGMAADKANFKDWWKKIKAEYTVKANIGVSGQEYKKYGTTFDNQILVIDKTGKTEENEITGKVSKVEELIPLLEGVRDARTYPGESKPAEHGVKKGAEEARPEARPNEPVLPATGGVVAGQPGRGEGQPAPKQPGVAPGLEPGEGGAIPGARPDRGETRPGAVEQVEETGRPGGSTLTGSSRQPAEADSGIPEVSGLTVEQKLDIERETEELSESIFDTYKPAKLIIPNAKPHPGKLVESAAMAAVEPIDPTYRPHIPENVIKEGKISLAQLEAIVYAGQAHEETLPSGERKGYFIGDGTGVGKGREIAAIIWDNFNQGRKKALWISQNSPLIKDAARDIEGVGWDPNLLFDVGKVNLHSDIPQTKGIGFVGYGTLKMEKSTEGKKVSRLNQIAKWLGEDFDGVIVFDESHNMGNAVAVKGKRGMTKPSATALAGIDLQKMLPKARVVYVSATGATEVMNLAYATRLGLWGDKTPFSDSRTFVQNISVSGIGIMEMVAQNMKAMGVYTARSLSYEDVKYGFINHILTPEQREIYNEMAKGWQIVLKNIRAAMELTGIKDSNTGRTMNSHAVAATMSKFWGTNQRFWNQIITSMQMPSVVSSIEQDLKNGHSAVVQLVNTNEAAQERAIARLEEGEELEDLDLTPRDALMEYVKNSFPVQQFEEYTDENGNVKSRPVYDSNGNPVENKEAVAMREALLNRLGSLRVPDGPLEILLNHFGTDNVAEVTGRTRRVVYKNTPEGKKRVSESWGKTKGMADADQFMDGKKKILVFSYAGGTGRSYHADLTAKNQDLRRHYLVQAGWRADRAVQGLGRTHRTNQKQAPEWILVTTDLQGQKRFISSIARRLDQLGALTRGERKAGSQGLFSARDNLESQEARDALRQLIFDMYHGATEMTIGEFEEQTGLSGLIDSATGALNETKLPDIAQFLNRILNMNIEAQDKLFRMFSYRHDIKVAEAIRQGTLDEGMQTIRAKKTEKIQEQVIYKDDKTKAETKYVEVELTHDAKRLNYMASKNYADHGYVRNIKSGRVWALGKQKSITDTRTGEVKLAYVAVGANYNYHNIPVDETKDATKYEQIPDARAREAWEAEYSQMPTEVKERVHMIIGAILPIWDRLPSEGQKVYRLNVDGKNIIGRVIPKKFLKETLENLGAHASKVEYTPADMFANILHRGYKYRLANNWRIERRKVAGDYRIEIIGPSYNHIQELSKYGVFDERISYTTRYFIPTNKEVGTNAIKEIISTRPVAEEEVPHGVKAGEVTVEDIEAGNVKFSVRDQHRAGTLKPAKLEDVKKFFPGQEVGKDRNGNIYVKTRGGKYVTFYKVDRIDADNAVLQAGYGKPNLAPGAVIPGAMGVTSAGDFYIKLHRTFGDTWTLAHESMHFMETSGIINSLDVSALKAHIKRLHREGKWETANKQDIGGPEDRANFIADRLAVKEQKGPIGRIILRIRAFIDGILETFGVRSPESILRGIESGRVFERTGREGKGATQFDIASPTDTKAFKDWFGKSKVVDENGEPLVVYHHTLNSFDSFAFSSDIGFHFGSKVAALDRAEQVGVGEVEIETDSGPRQIDYDSRLAADNKNLSMIKNTKDRLYFVMLRKLDSPRANLREIINSMGEEEAVKTLAEFEQQKDSEQFKKRVKAANSIPKTRVIVNGEVLGEYATRAEADRVAARKKRDLAKPMAVYLSIKNPIRLPDLGVWSAQEIAKAAGFNGKELYRVRQVTGDAKQQAIVREILIEKGYDGVVYENEVEDRGRDSYIAFSPTQIKSVDNTGTFSKTNPNIMFEVMTPELPDFMQQYLDSKAEAVEKEFKPFAFDEKSSKNEGLFQLHPSKEFKDFRRVDSWYGVPLTDGVYFVVGTREGYREPQAIRFDKSKFDEKTAAKWWKKHKKYFNTKNLWRPEALKEMPDPKDPQKVNSWIKDEADNVLQTIVHKMPGNLPHLTWLEKMLKSPEWYSHPVLSRIVRIMMRTRPELYHENFNYLTENNVVEATRALRRKGLTKADRLIGKTSKEYKLLQKFIDVGDTTWKRDKKEPLQDQIDKFEQWMRMSIPADMKDSADEIINVWRLHRESYDKALGLMTAQLEAMIKELSERAEEKGESPNIEKMRKTLKYHLAKMEEWKGFYAPRVRQPGNWWVWAYRGPEGSRKYFMDFRGSELAAGRLANHLKREGYTISRIQESPRLPEDVYNNIKSIDVARAIEKAIKDMKSGLQSEAHSELLLKFNEEVLENVSDMIKARGFRSTMIHRRTDKLVKGYKEDPLERLLVYTNNISRGLAKATAAKMVLNELLGEVNEDGKRVGGIDPVKESRAYITAEQYIEEQLRNIDQSDRIIGLAKSIATFKYLGFNLRSAFVNSTAIVTTAPPAIQQYALDGKVGFTKILNALATASKDYGMVMAGKPLANEDEQAFMDEIKKKGYDDPQYTRDALGSIMKSQHRAWGMLMDASMYIFGKTEQWNRGTTMLAAYRLARKQGYSHADSAERAKMASDKAHGVYGKATMPAWAQGKNPAAKIGQLMYVYGKFSHNYMQMLYDLGVKKHNLKAFTFAMIAPLVVGGLAAFPFREQIFGIVGFILKALFGEDRDPEKWVWDTIRKNLGDTAELYARHGMTGAMGLDISSSLSIGVGIPKGFADLTGAAGGVVEDVMQAGHYAKQGRIGRALEKAAPRVAENVVKAFREYDEGVTTKAGHRVWDVTGKPFKPTMGESVERALGFRSARQAVISERTWEAKRQASAFEERKRAIYERYRAYLAAGGNDPKEFNNIREARRRFNEGLKAEGIKEVSPITFEAMRRQVKEMRKPSKREREMLRD